MIASGHNPKVDTYIQKARPFAQPILTHIRQLVHKACPEAVETIKWSRPFFEYRGVIVCMMAGFKSHCTLMFWGKEMRTLTADAKNNLRRITGIDELPSDKTLLAWIRESAANIDSGSYISPIAARSKVAKAPQPALKAPPQFTKAMNQNPKARSAFAAFSPRCKREYIEWIAEAKRPETRDKRIAEAIEWIAEGKERNWKYQK